MNPFLLQARSLIQPKPLALGCGAIVLAALALFIAVPSGAADDKKTAAPKPALTVTTVKPQLGRLSVKLTANGNIAAWQEASIGTESSGLRLTQVNANVGDVVRAGQVLAVFSPETIQADLAQARANLVEAEANASDAAGNAERARTLQNSGALSTQQINQYQTSEQTAKARVEAARALLAVQQLRLRHTQVLAPDSGIISARSATVGAVLAGGTELFRMIRQGRLEWRAEVTSAELGRLSPGTVAIVTAASGAQLKGRVRMIAPTVDPQTRSALVYVDLPATPGMASPAKAGMFARGEFALGESSALTVPQTAVVVRDGFSYVYRLGADNRVAQIKVQTGRLSADQIEIVSALSADARLVESGAGFLNDGDLVRVVEDGKTVPAPVPPRPPRNKRARAMNVSSWSIKNPIPAVMLFVLLTFAGLLSFNAMKVQNFPDIELPTVSVTAALPGAAPAQLETEVARKIENALATIQGLKHLYTKVQDGSVTITAEFRLEKPVQEAVDDVRSAVATVRSDLPGDLRDPIVSKMDFAAQPVLAFTIRSVPRGDTVGMDDEALSWFVDNDVTRKLLAVRGVGAVNRVGGVNREVRVSLDAMRLQALGATAADISHQLRQVQLDSAGGRTDVGGGEQPVRTVATVRSAQELGDLQLALSDGRRIRLDQVATVTDTTAEPRSAALLNGKPVVGFEVARSKGESEVAVGAAVQKALAELKLQHPDIELTEAFNFVAPVEEEYTGSMHLLYEGAILAVLVVWLFLRDWRATLVSAVALPLSVIPAFVGMYLLGFSVNVITLLALSLVVGILVDDAIVEVENIVRHLRMGKSPYQAAMEAADEIGLAVIATTFTLVAVFLPTAFMSGVPGKFFKQFGWTASLAVMASLLVARVLTPMMAAYILKPIVTAHEDPRWMKTYMRWAVWCMEHRIWTMVAATVFFFGSVALIPLLPTGFIPPDDNSQTQVYLELPPGSTLLQTKSAAEQARMLVSKVAHVQSVYTTIGGGSAGGDPFAMSGSAEVRKATLTVLLAGRDQRPRKQGIENNIRAALESVPGVRSKVGLGGSGEKYVMVLTGEDPVALQAAALAVEKDLRTIPGLGSVASSASLIRPEITVRPDFAKAADLGVTSAAIGETLRIATMGDYDMSLAKLNLSQRQVPIVVKLDEAARQDLGVLERLSVPGQRGPVMLGQVATLEITGGPAVIDRYDRARNVNFEIELSGLPLGDVTAAVQQLPSVKQLPPGVKVVEIGDAEVMGELFASFGLAMLTGVLCIYIVLVLLFKNFLHPVTILCALPLALGGAFVGLLIAQKSFSMPSLIGLIMLMGIATKNSILLVEYAIVARRDHHMSRFEALKDACHKRARPIIMTTLAMGAGMMPIALGLGAADPSFRSPMSIAVIGGLITSTVLSLLVVPAVFTYVDDIGNWAGRMAGKLRRRGETASVAETPRDPASVAAPPSRA